MANEITVKFKKFDSNLDLFIPEYKTEGSSGMDLQSIESTVLEPNQILAIRTNLTVEIPPGYELQVRPRSGLALKHGITVLNTPGTIDSDYRGEIMVILYNASSGYFTINKGDRIAQIVLSKVEKIAFLNSELSETERGSGGFGSTGVNL